MQTVSEYTHCDSDCYLLWNLIAGEVYLVISVDSMVEEQAKLRRGRAEYRRDMSRDVWRDRAQRLTSRGMVARDRAQRWTRRGMAEWAERSEGHVECWLKGIDHGRDKKAQAKRPKRGCRHWLLPVVTIVNTSCVFKEYSYSIAFLEPQNPRLIPVTGNTVYRYRSPRAAST